MKKVIHCLGLAAIIVFILPSCAIIREGEVGVKRTLGTYKDKPFESGLRFYNPFASTIVKVSTQTENLEVGLSIPSKEGLNISAEVSILYNLQARKTPDILRSIGLDYEANIILPVFRSAVADVSSRFYAKDMHTGERAQIELAIRDQMMTLLKGNGIEIEAVLLKSIKLPPSLSKAIEEKLEAEQNALRMEFVLQQEQREAERKRIQAAGVRDAQIIIAEGLSQPILQFKALEAFMELSKSPNTKVIITDNTGTPLLMNPEMTEGTQSHTGMKVNNK